MYCCAASPPVRRFLRFCAVLFLSIHLLVDPFVLLEPSPGPELNGGAAFHFGTFLDVLLCRIYRTFENRSGAV